MSACCSLSTRALWLGNIRPDDSQTLDKKQEARSPIAHAFPDGVPTLKALLRTKESPTERSSCKKKKKKFSSLQFYAQGPGARAAGNYEARGELGRVQSAHRLQAI